MATRETVSGHSQRKKIAEGEVCLVCSDLASGYHYGIASCNGCKTFFRRTIVNKQVFTCQYNGDCDVSKNIRCACRSCRFNKCLQVGMDRLAIQNDRDRIGSKRSNVDPNLSSECASPPAAKGQLKGSREMEQLINIEMACNCLRVAVLPDISSTDSALVSPSLIYSTLDLPIDLTMQPDQLHAATMMDIQFWNKREIRLCLEWAKTFSLFNDLPRSDQMALLRNFAFTFNVMNRSFYSINHGPDMIVFPNGAYIPRQPQRELHLAGCQILYSRQMDEIMTPFRKMKITYPEFAIFKAVYFFNPDAQELSEATKIIIYAERQKYLSALFDLMVSNHDVKSGSLLYGNLLMMASSIQTIVTLIEENMKVLNLFQEVWKMDDFVKELCMKQ